MINLSLCMNLFCFAQEDTLLENEIDNTIESEDITTLDDTTTNNIFGADTEWENDTNTTIQDNWNMNDKTEETDIWDIIVWFCNEWLDNISNSLKSAVKQGTPFKVCVIFNNRSNYDAEVQVEIVDKLMNPQWYEVCNYNKKNIQNFIWEDSLEELDNIHIPAQNYIIKEFYVTFPIWIGWEQKSCFTYNVKHKNKPVSTLNIVYSKYHDMDFFVWDAWDIDNKVDLNGINLYINENKFLQLDFNIDNIWNLENQVTIHGTLSNIFWFKKDFEFNVWNIWIWWSLTGTIDLWPLPNYGWLFNVTLTATATPFFSYNIDESTFDKDLLEPKDFTVTASYFQMPWIAIIILIFVIMFIIVAFRKPKKEVVYVQAPQWPMPNNWYQQPQYQVPQQNQYQQPQPNPTQFQQPYPQW